MTDRPARATSSQMQLAVRACDFALVVWELPAGVVLLANEAAAHLLDVPLADLPGMRNVDMVSPPEAVTSAFAVMSSGAVDDLRSERRVRTRTGRIIEIQVWSRSIELEGGLSAVSLFIPDAEVGRLGRDPSRPWRELAPVALGTADRDGAIRQVSSDIQGIIGREPSGCAGTSLLDLIHPDDAARLGLEDSDAELPARSYASIRLRHRDGSWVTVCLLVASVGEGADSYLVFALLGPPSVSETARSDRVADLEMRLRHIGAEVRAAGVLGELDPIPSISDYPQLSELSSRQWEILSRLLRGERAGTIASELFLSPSTVRNHLSTIFRRFGVHSQSELLASIRRTEPRNGG